MRKVFTGFILSVMLLAACSESATVEEEENNQGNDQNENETEQEEEQEEETFSDSVQELSAEYGIETEPLEITAYGEETGFTLSEPVYAAFATDRSFLLEGNLESLDDINEDYLWVRIRADTGGDSITDEQEYDYYLPLEENGDFSKEIFLHAGAQDYNVTVLIPSNDPLEDNQFYDGAAANVTNINEEIDRDIHYSMLGFERELAIDEPADGFIETERSFPLSGTLPGAGEDEFVFITVNYDNERAELLVPVENESFEADIPLSFGEGIHDIHIMLYVEEEELYYEGANILANRTTDGELVQIETYETYFERGVRLEEPVNGAEYDYEGNEYRVSGLLDSNAEGAGDVTHMIVTTEHEEGEAAHYYLPVEDYEFDDTIWFRFGEGEYDITVSVPDPWEEGSDYFEFFGVASFSHNVNGAEDQRSLLPSVGIESDHPDIIELANEVTDGLDDERDMAEAVYEYVATNISYDVEKLNDNLFEMDDSALKTLDLKSGVCQDYAFLAIAMLRALDMEANYVAGIVPVNERHAWVEVKVDGEWLEMDPTWGAGYVDDNDEFHFSYNTDYFDPDPDFLDETHTRQEIIY